MSDAEIITQRVHRGAEWLDYEDRSWFWRINVERLSMKECHECVLGQLFGHYEKMPDELWDKVQSHGFTLPKAVMSRRRWRILGDAWKHEIETRQKGDLSQ